RSTPMAAQPSSPSPTTTRGAPSAPGAHATRLSGRQLRAVRVAWATLASLLVGLYVLLLPACWVQLQTVCAGVRCAATQPSPASAAALHSLGLSVAGYAWLTLSLTLLSSLTCFVLAGVIVWRKSDDWMALLVALAEVALGTALVFNLVGTDRSAWQVPALIA